MKMFRHVVLLLLSIVGMAAVAQTPTVVTDTRFARGATMAFGRMTISGVTMSNVAERGFCYSTDSREPTVADEVTTDYITNNGQIFWLKDLKPATRYYMRAYAKMKDGSTGYGSVIKFYTLPRGQITFSMRTSGDENSERIRAAAQTAVDWWNDLTEMRGFSPNIGYNAGTPTAECSYGGWMSVGPNTSYQRPGTIMHEMLHGCGVIPWAGTQWSQHTLRSGVNSDGYGTGYWLGDRVTEVLRFWDNDETARLNGDYQHMWPYGINGAHEDTGSTVLYIGNGLICQALGEDGLEHTSSHFAEPYYALDQEDGERYYIKCEDENRGFYTSYLTEGDGGTLRWEEKDIDTLDEADDAAWYVTFTPDNQFYQFRNVATGNYLSLSGSAVRTVATPSDNTDFHLMKARIDAADTKTSKPNPRGYWLLHHANRNPRAVAASTGGRVVTETFNIGNAATTQRWLILDKEQLAEVDRVGLGAFKAQVASILEQLRQLKEVPHYEESTGIDAALDDAIAEIEAEAESALSAVKVARLVEKARQAEFDFLSQATPTDLSKPFDISLLIKNPGMDDTEGWVGLPALYYSCAEFYEKDFDFYQTIENLPKGTYILKAQGFHRPGRAEIAYNYFSKGYTTRISAFLYAGLQSVRLKNICEEGQAQPLGKGTETAVGDPVIYIPDNTEAAAEYFRNGLYDNEVASSVATDGGSLKIGVRCRTASSLYWTAFDNFRLYYYGSHSLEEVTAIPINQNPTPNGQHATHNTIYDMQGRQIAANESEQLPKGVYIVRSANGKQARKIVIK